MASVEKIKMQSLGSAFRSRNLSPDSVFTQSPVRSISALVLGSGGSLFRLLLYMDDLNEE